MYVLLGYGSHHPRVFGVHWISFLSAREREYPLGVWMVRGA